MEHGTGLGNIRKNSGLVLTLAFLRVGEEEGREWKEGRPMISYALKSTRLKPSSTF